MTTRGPALVRRVQFYTNPQRDYTADTITVLQSEFAHDVVSVILRPQSDTDWVFETGMPVIVEWGVLSGDTKTLHGYVHHTEPISGGLEQGRTLKLVCIGATYPMNEPVQRVWRNTTVTRIVESLIDSQKLSGECQPHKQIWPSLVQSTSDWGFLVALAKKVGWTVCVDSTDIQVREPLFNLSAQIAVAPLFRGQRDRTRYANIRSFHAISGETTPDGGEKSARILAGLDMRTAESFSISSAPVFGDSLGTTLILPAFTNYEASTANSVAEAQSELAGVTHTNRWHIQAKLEANGQAKVKPGMLIAILGVSHRHDGYWYVQSVEHEIDASQYTIHMSLGRDAEFNRFATPRSGARRVVIPQRMTPYGTPVGEKPPTIFNSGRWRAAYSPRQYRAG